MAMGSVLAYDLLVAILCLALVALVLTLVITYTKKKQVELEPSRPTARVYRLSDVDAATSGFNHRCVLGRGRLGTVYAGVIADGGAVGAVAVKRIHPHLVLSNAGSSFSYSIMSLSSASHPHVVSILGYAEGPGERIVLMELAGLKSLEFHLHESNSTATPILDWSRRVRVAAGAARGIEYLHEGAASSIVHGCIKPSNILIDLNWDGRVSDYGLSFLAPPGWRGLVGYLDREYEMEKGGLCKASDVFAFGVVLLELLSGRRCEEGLIVEWALPLIKQSRVVEILDPRLGMPHDVKPLVRLAKVASACVSNTRKNRPSISQVATILNSLKF